jgi:uncharacterized metal-binding protein
VTSDKKVLIIPCSGIGKPIGTISRETTYEIIEKSGSGKVETVCLALLTSQDKETMDKVKNNFVITLDGCAKHCAKKNTEQCGKIPDKSYMILKFAAANPDKKPRGIIDIGNSGKALVDIISDTIVKDVNSVLEDSR